MSESAIVRWIPNAPQECWNPMTLDQLGKDEKFFENILVRSPELLSLESRRTGIHGPFQIFQQVAMETPSGRSIYPDIVILAASGHVIVIEVKRYVNPELRDRAVIAQIIDYASSFAALSEKDCIKLFADDHQETWTDSISAMFPKEPSPDELADMLLRRMQTGEVNLIIACDKIPSGLPDVVSGIATQSAFGFGLDLIEVVPWVREVSETAEILFVPSTRLTTEIVSRTAVTVTYREGDSKPSINVQTTSLEDIEESIRTSSGRVSSDARTWTPEQVEEQFRREGNETAVAMLDFVKEHSADGQIISPGKKKNPVFGFYVTGLKDGVNPTKCMIFNCIQGWNCLYLYFNAASNISDDAIMSEFRHQLKEIFGNELDVNKVELGISYDVLSKHIHEFQELMLWFKRQVARNPADYI